MSEIFATLAAVAIGCAVGNFVGFWWHRRQIPLQAAAQAAFVANSLAPIVGELRAAIANIPQRGKPGRPPKDPSAPAKRVRKPKAKAAAVPAVTAPVIAAPPADTHTAPLPLDDIAQAARAAA